MKKTKTTLHVKAATPKKARKIAAMVEAAVAEAAPALLKEGGRFAGELAAAKGGKVPKAPDFSAPSRERYRGKLDTITKLVKAKDVQGLQALSINPVDSANKIMARYRDHALIALQAVS
jgi:hypothetical protein